MPQPPLQNVVITRTVDGLDRTVLGEVLAGSPGGIGHHPDGRLACASFYHASGYTDPTDVHTRYHCTTVVSSLRRPTWAPAARGCWSDPNKILRDDPDARLLAELTVDGEPCIAYLHRTPGAPGAPVGYPAS